MGKVMNFKMVYRLLKNVVKLLLKVDKKRFNYSIVFFIFSGTYSSLNVIIFRGILNSLQQTNIITNQLIINVFLYFILSFTNIVMQKFNEYSSFKFKNRVNLYVNKKILKKTNEMNLTHFEDTEIYNLIQKADNQATDAVYNYFLNSLTIISTGIAILSNGILLLFWKWYLFVLIIIVSIFRAYILAIFGKQSFSVYNNRVTEERKKWYYSYILKNEFAFKEIKIYNLHHFFLKKYIQLYNQFFIQDLKLEQKRVYTDFLLSCLNLFIMIILFIATIYETLERKILVGTALSFIQSGNNIRNSSETLMSSITTLSTNSLFIDQLFQFFEMDFSSEIKKQEKGMNPGEIKVIELKNVSFYRGNKLILNNINIKLEKNKIYSIVGTNGAGKSTLIRLILGLYTNYEGNILINDINLRNINLKDYWNKLGVLFQDYCKYELTLRENIVSYHNIKDSVIIKLLNSLDDSFMNKFKLNSQLGYWFDNGKQLSGGEWIKVAMARSLIKNPQLIIADEPNASLDNISQNNLYEVLKKNSKNSIVLLISHRIKNLSKLNSTIIMLDNKTVIAEGYFQELLNNEAFNALLKAEN